MKRYALGIGLGTFMLAASALAAGPFDGSWTGEVAGVSMGRGTGCPAATLKATVTDGKLTGLFSDGKYNYQVRGTVQPDGTLAQAFMGTNPLSGKFTGNEFAGSYVSTGCEGKTRQWTMHKTG
jgi:hypothetical protein